MKKFIAIIASTIILMSNLTNVSAMEVQYGHIATPNVNSSFKPYMDYRTITNKRSNQYKLLQDWAWTDNEGFIRANGERDLGIKDDYYYIALGSYYGTKIGQKYRITLMNGTQFYGILGDCKDDSDTNSTHMYGRNNDVVEFIVDTKKLNKNVKVMGTANVYMPLNGIVSGIERIDFVN